MQKMLMGLLVKLIIGYVVFLYSITTNNNTNPEEVSFLTDLKWFQFVREDDCKRPCFELSLLKVHYFKLPKVVFFIKALFPELIAYSALKYK